ncbi:2-keto-4-pentenoate hydratase [Amorphus sp. 3PC139-8]|uniref:2-keto-4-pentenoate hydratase n=1 Tax=Amorphus sp. 3PC139-8 TaxID=2735676 RepID=UPI00345D4180
MTANVERIAESLFEARTHLKQVAPPRETMGLTTVAEAQAVQDRNTERWLSAGRRMVGRKIGLTSKAVQAQIGVNEPDYGVLWADYGFSGGDAVPISRFMQPRAEAEVAFVMERAVSDPQASMTDLMRSVAYALPALEIVDSAVANWDIRLVDTIADNASGGGFALGTSPRRITDVDLRLGGAILSRNGVAESLGVGAACLGHPLAATLWLARKMATLGRPLDEGDIVLSGALGPMIPVAAGDVFSIEIQGFEPFQIAFGEGAQDQ